MGLNIALAREIYGNTPWAVDRQTMVLLSKIDQLDFEAKDQDVKNNSLDLYNLKSGTIVLRDTYELRKDYTSGDSLVYIVNLNGPITKGGGTSSYGVKDMIRAMDKFQADARILGGIIVADSGGGSTAAMELMSYNVKNALKPVVGFIERGGMACSACLGILSNTSWIIAEDGNSDVGSIGTMMAISGVPNGKSDISGEKHFSIYATKSTAKNKWYEEVINNDNIDLAVSEILDPVNERFLKSMKANRPNIKDTQMDGSVYKASEVVGTLIDEIGTFQSAVNKILELSKSNSKFSQNSKRTNSTRGMNQSEIKAQFPEAYAAIRGEGYAEGVTKGITEGVSKEQERVSCWQVFASIDPEAVNKGISEGRDLKQSEALQFQLKAANKGKLESLQLQSAPPVIVPPAGAESTAEKTADEQEAANIFAGLLPADKIKLN